MSFQDPVADRASQTGRTIVTGGNSNAENRASATASARMILRTPASYVDWVINLAREFLRATGQPES